MHLEHVRPEELRELGYHEVIRTLAREVEQLRADTDEQGPAMTTTAMELTDAERQLIEIIRREFRDGFRLSIERQGGAWDIAMSGPVATSKAERNAPLRAALAQASMPLGTE